MSVYGLLIYSHSLSVSLSPISALSAFARLAPHMNLHVISHGLPHLSLWAFSFAEPIMDACKAFG